MSSRNEVRFLAFTEEGRENVEAAHKLASENKLKCTWVTVEEVNNLEDSKDSKEEIVYVADPIEGPEVGDVIDHLVNLNYPVLGPQCALTVLKHGIRLQDDLKYPLYTLTLLNTTICFSNIQNEERIELVHLVELMGGKVSRPLHCDVTHLVVGEVGSVKYFTAASINIKIMTKEWIYHLWKHGMSRYICAKDGKWEEFLCPIFLGCKVCMTGFGTTEKTRVQKLVTKFGGDYSGAMKLNYTTHLIVNKPEGQKYAMASGFGVKVVNINWIYDSVEKGSCQDNTKYPVKLDGFKKSVNQSTPESHAKSSRIESMADVSCIDPSMINETVASTMNDTSRMSTIGLPVNQSMLPPVGQLPSSRISNPTRNLLMSFPMNKDYSEILDGIHVYLVGFHPDEEEKMGKLLSLASAIKYNQLTSSVSCVIVGNLSKVSQSLKSDIVTACAQNPDLRVVNQSWVLESLKKGELVLEKNHWESSIIPIPADHHDMENDETKMDTTTEASATTVHDNKSTVKRNPISRSSAATGNKNLDGSMLGFLHHNDEVDDNEMLSQYMINPQLDDVGHNDDDDMQRRQTPEVADTMHEGSSFLRRKLRTEYGDETNMDIDETRPQDNETTEMESTTMQSETSITNIFAGKVFFIFGFSAEELEELTADIESYAGSVLPVNSKHIADYAVVPLTGWPVDRTVQDVVTNFWIKFSIEEGRLIETDEHPMCIPFSVPPDSYPLQECVACLSKYRDSERVYLSRLIEDLGGLVQEVVARRDTKDLKQTTHLIINEPGGDKYDGCKSWGIVTVTEEWVYESAKKGKRMIEDEFSVDKPRRGKQTENITSVPQSSSTTAREAVSRSEVLSKVSKIKSHSYVGWNTEFPPMPRPPSVVDKIRKRLEAKADAEKKAREEAIKNKETPLRVRYKRLNLETPSKFMTKGGPPVNVSFDLTEVFELLKTPVEKQKKIREEMKENPETPMSVFLSRCLDEGVKNIPDELIMNLEKKLTEQTQVKEEMQEAKDCDTTTNSETTDPSSSNIFSNLVISLAKKLHNQFSDLGKLISNHGGEFRWTYDNACTHFLFQGKLNDKNKEFCAARRDGKFIVSPYWINACIQTSSRIDESLFPHVYDPNKSIQMVSTSPPKTRRRTLRNSTSSNDNKSSSSGKSGNSSNSTESEEDTTSTKTSKIKGEPEIEDSQEARENLRKKLEHIMSATNLKNEKHMHRLSCSRVNTPSPSIAAAQRRTTTTSGTPLPMKSLDHDKTELSQDVQVSWDDPTGREEMERLMKERNTTTDDSNFKVPADVSINNLETTKDDEETVFEDQGTEDQDIPQTIKDGLVMRFHMSSVSLQEKTKYIEIIKELGGEFLDGGSIDPTATHLLVTKPGRSEKFLSALASGKCIVNAQYLNACKEANRFILEEKFEYGNPLNPSTNEYLVKPDVLQSQISLSPYRWRTKLRHNEKETGIWKGSFGGWKVILHVSDRQMKGFERLLKCGSADVIATQLPLHGKLGNITHAFIDPEKAKQLDSWILEELVAKSGVHVCNPSYIGDYLLKNPPPEPSSQYLPQVSSIYDKIDHENDDGREVKRRKID
uniref:DNA topoisomerase 2-binding protein 1-like n=1 Tax=Styela clava TaxID=7725 RepID=UPI001939F7E1|nr:DNA topoisomerase 2-binding protein 1-like [Styela clava]